jgi:hypothetical protein
MDSDDSFRLISPEAADRVVFVICLILLILSPYSELFFDRIGR